MTTHRFNKGLALASLVATGILFAACNEAATTSAGEEVGAGDYDVAAGALYADTNLTPGDISYQRMVNNGDTVDARDVVAAVMRYRIGDSTVTTVGFVMVGIGDLEPESGEYDVYPYLDPIEGLAGKVRLYVWGVPGGMSWSDADSSAGARVKVSVTADSVQVIGKEIKLSTGHELSFNFTAPKVAAWNGRG